MERLPGIFPMLVYRVGGSPKAGNSPGPNVVISAIAPTRIRRTSNLNARNSLSPGF